MPVHQLNHAVLYVRDARVSATFYRDVLGFEPVGDMTMGGGAAMFLRAPASTNDHDLGLFSLGEVETLDDLRHVAERLSTRGALVGATNHGTTKSLYGRDPDGLEFEVVWLLPADLIEPADVQARSSLQPLDLEAEIARFGAQTPGGVGISRHVPA